MKIFVTIVLLLLASCNLLQAAKILCLVGTSHNNNPSWLRPLFTALAGRNHSLTILSTDHDNADNASEKNIVRLNLVNEYDVVDKHFVVKETQHYHEYWSVLHLLVWYESLLGNCRGIIETDFMKNKQEKFNELLNMEYDLIIYDATFSIDCLLSSLPDQQLAPILGVSGGKLTTDLISMVKGEDTINPARVPHYLTELPKKMSYWHRILNHVMYLGETFIHWSVVMPVLNGVLKKPYVNPSVQLMLLNTHPVLDYVQNMPPNVIEVGGLHIRSNAEIMPENIQEFMEKFVDGIVYINLPYIISMFGLGPAAVIKMIQSQPDCGFIWNVQNLPQLPENLPNLMTIEIENHFQQDILAQPKIKAFLTHGDSFSLQEAIYNAVPVIVLPLILEEFNNAQRIKERNLGVVIRPSEFTMDSFVTPLRSLLNDAFYTNSVYQAQIKFRTRVQKPMELAIWYAEQLIAEPKIYKYLGSGGNVRNYFVAHSLDVLALPAFVFIAFWLNLGFLIYQIVDGYKYEKADKLKKLNEAVAKKKKKQLKDKKKSKIGTKEKQNESSGSNTDESKPIHESKED